MKPSFRSPWLWAALLLTAILVGGVFFLRRTVSNVMHPALDTLAAVDFGSRWSHPEMLKIRGLGSEVIPSLRRVLREKDSPGTHFLLWLKQKWPGATNYLQQLPEPNKLANRRWTACQVLQTLGPAGRAAVPEIIQILRSNDIGDLNAATTALYAVGVDAEICERLDALLERGVPEHARSAIVSALGFVKPPSPRTLRALTAALADSSQFVQAQAAESLGRLGVPTPAAITGLKHLQSTSTNPLVFMSASVAVWDLEKNSNSVLPPVFRLLESELSKESPPDPWGGSGGQGVNGIEQLFMKAADLFPRMDLSSPDRSHALNLLDRFCQKSGRIFVRMLLLPAMERLGWPRENCLEVCRIGLDQPEDYYRLQAAELLVTVAQKYPVPEVNLDAVIRHQDVGVRVYGSKIHWLKNRQADVVVPVLVEALDRAKHQSYYYAQIQPAALGLLAEIGPAAKAAVPALHKTEQDPNPAVVKLASETLRKIGN